ncbi:hypothetical protein Tco_1236884 [Tanacetum coccineum]
MRCGEEINGMLRINLCEAITNEEIFTFVAWIRAFNINELIYSELCHEFYSTYEFNEVCADDELKTKKIIKFRLVGSAHGGLRSDEHFNAQEYWLSISQEENLSLSRKDNWMKRKGAGTQRERESLICCGQFITKLARKARVLSDEDLYERIGSMEIRQGAIERMAYRQSYHWDRYARVFEHMAGVYNVPLQGTYNPPGYAQPQFDQYYQQYPPQ